MSETAAMQVLGRKTRQLAERLGKEQANTAILRRLVAECRHEVVTHSGLYAHDGNPAHAWRLDSSRLIATIDATLQILGGDA